MSRFVVVLLMSLSTSAFAAGEGDACSSSNIDQKACQDLMNNVNKPNVDEFCLHRNNKGKRADKDFIALYTALAELKTDKSCEFDSAEIIYGATQKNVMPVGVECVIKAKSEVRGDDIGSIKIEGPTSISIAFNLGHMQKVTKDDLLNGYTQESSNKKVDGLRAELEKHGVCKAAGTAKGKLPPPGSLRKTETPPAPQTTGQ